MRKPALPSRLVTWLSTRPALQAGIVIFGLAFAFRSAALLFFWSDSLFVLNGAELAKLARGLYAGRGFESPWAPGEPSAWIAPFTPVLWLGLLTLTKGSAAATGALVVGLQTVASSATVVVFWRIAVHIAKEAGDRLRRFPFALGLALAFWPDAVTWLTVRWYFVWQELGIACVILLGIRWCQRPSVSRVVQLGALGGLVGLVNPVTLVLLPVLVLIPLVRRRMSFGPWFTRAAAGALVSVLVLLPWSVRNYMVFDQVVPVRSNFGLELWQGNNANGSVRQWAASLHPDLDDAERARYVELGELAYVQEAQQRGLDFIRANPVLSARRVVARVYAFWIGDLTDRWSWSGERWWQEGVRVALISFIRFASAIGPLVFLVWTWRGAPIGRMPHFAAVAAVLLVVPTPHYLTVSGLQYAYLTRPWLILLGLYGMYAGRSREPAADA